MKRKIGRLFARVQGVLRRVWQRWFPSAERTEVQLAAPRPETPPPVVSPTVVDLDYEEVLPEQHIVLTREMVVSEPEPPPPSSDSAIAALIARVDRFLNMGVVAETDPEPEHRIDAVAEEIAPAEEPAVPEQVEIDEEVVLSSTEGAEVSAEAVAVEAPREEVATEPVAADVPAELELEHRIDAVAEVAPADEPVVPVQPIEVLPAFEDETVPGRFEEEPIEVSVAASEDAASEPAAPAEIEEVPAPEEPEHRIDALPEQAPPVLMSEPYYELSAEEELARLDASEEATATSEEREAVAELMAAMERAAEVEEALQPEQPAEPEPIVEPEAVAASEPEVVAEASPDDEAVSAMVDAAEAAEEALPQEPLVEPQPEQPTEAAPEPPVAETAAETVAEAAPEPAPEPEGPAPFRNPLPTVEIPTDYMPAAESAHELYQLQLDGFEGPLDLLLHLIKRHHLDIFDIPVSFICERYLAYIKMMEDLDIDVASEFLFMASELLHLKSRMLLPRPEGEATDEEEIDPRAELVRRLLEYQKYKEAAEQFSGFYRLGRDTFERPAEAVPPPEGDAPLKEVGLFALTKAFEAVLKRQRPEVRHQVMLEQVSVRQRIRTLVQRFETQESVRFDVLLEGAQRRIDIVVTFLALLEMGKLKLLRIFQSEDGVIYVHPKFDDASLAFARLEGLDESQYA